MFNKKAQSSTMTLEELIKIILGFIILLFIMAFLTMLYMVFTSKAVPMEEADFLRVKQDLETFTLNSKPVITPIFSNEIIFRTLVPTKDIKGCKKETFCLCYKTSESGKENCEEVAVSNTFDREEINDVVIKVNELRPYNHTVIILNSGGKLALTTFS